MKRSILKKWLVLEVVALAIIVVGSFSFTNTSEAPASDGYTIGDAAND